ncbi:MAG: PLP-dependent aminotransferase family protein [Micromonosporaceae bacterium]
MARAKPGVPEESISAGADFLQLDIREAPAGGRAGWLAGRLRLAISDGRLPVGSRLPASRVLAADLWVSRGVVTEAYRRLSEDGHVVGRRRAGTVVVAAPPIPPVPAPPRPVASPTRPVAHPTGPAEASASELFAGTPGLEIFDAVRAAPARIDLSPGVPDLGAFPRAAWLRAERAVLGRLVPADFGYGDPRGTPALRTAVASWLARYRGIRVDPGDVVVVAGVAQALGLFAEVLRRDGITAVAVEDPGSLGVRQHLNNWGLDTPPVPVDDAGIRVDQLHQHAAVMLTPAHQFPTGVVLDGDRRRQLMRWAEAGGLIVEDDYDAKHRYDRPPVPALRSILAEQVFYTGSVSKLLAPALRIGWALVPARYRDAMVAAKRNADLGNAALPQLVLAELMGSGGLERHLRLLRRRHVRRRDAMIDAIRTHLPGATVHGAPAGLHLMVTFDAEARDAEARDAEAYDVEIRDAELAAAALARGVKVQPLSWHRQRPGPPGLLLGYAASPPTEIAAGIATLGEALRELRDRRRRTRD